MGTHLLFSLLETIQIGHQIHMITTIVTSAICWQKPNILGVISMNYTI